MIARRLLTVLATALLLFGHGTPAQAHEEKFDELVISHPWSRATATNQKVGAVFLEVQTKTGRPDRLIGASMPDAETVEIHDHIRDGDMMRMRRIDGVDIPAEGSAVLKPGGQHLMLIGLKVPLFEETVFPMTLVFEKAGSVEIEVIVEAAGAGKAKAGGDHQRHQMTK